MPSNTKRLWKAHCAVRKSPARMCTCVCFVLHPDRLLQRHSVFGQIQARLGAVSYVVYWREEKNILSQRETFLIIGRGRLWDDVWNQGGIWYFGSKQLDCKSWLFSSLFSAKTRPFKYYIKHCRIYSVKAKDWTECSDINILDSAKWYMIPIKKYLMSFACPYCKGKIAADWKKPVVLIVL